MEGRGECICPLSWSVHCNFVRDGNYSGSSQGKFFHHDGMYTRKRPLPLYLYFMAQTIGRGAAPALKEGQPVLVVITFITVVLDRECIGRDPRFLYCCIVWPLLNPSSVCKEKKAPERGKVKDSKIPTIIAEVEGWGWR
jgi:hypothetical protein